MENIGELILFKKVLNESPIGQIVIIWSRNPNFKIEEIILSNPQKTADEIAQEKYPNLEKTNSKKTPKKLKKIIKQMNKFFNEKDTKFSLDYLNLDKLTPFQKEVLIAEFNTEKGTINTYGSLAKMLNKPKSYRAVGNALANNPFPIIIPCHRTIKSDRTIGGFGGFGEGLESKKTLLALEGIMVEGKKVVSESPIIALDKKEQRKITSYIKN